MHGIVVAIDHNARQDVRNEKARRVGGIAPGFSLQSGSGNLAFAYQRTNEAKVPPSSTE
jgi:hypothetical protein